MLTKHRTIPPLTPQMVRAQGTLATYDVEQPASTPSNPANGNRSIERGHTPDTLSALARGTGTWQGIRRAGASLSASSSGKWLPTHPCLLLAPVRRAGVVPELPSGTLNAKYI